MPDDPKQVKPSLPDFPAWVVGQLRGIVENDANAVTRWIVGQWIKDNEEWLATRKITYERFYEERKGGGPRGTVTTMKPPAPQKGSKTRDGNGTDDT
jgi:hypothetical protein